jgi:hypothetical protein
MTIWHNLAARSTHFSAQVINSECLKRVEWEIVGKTNKSQCAREPLRELTKKQKMLHARREMGERERANGAMKDDWRWLRCQCQSPRSLQSRVMLRTGRKINKLLIAAAQACNHLSLVLRTCAAARQEYYIYTPREHEL